MSPTLMVIDKTADEFLRFWFSEAASKYWFKSTPEFDDSLRERFLELYELAMHGQLDDWRDTAPGSLALVILFDQIPLNIFRGKPQSFASEEQARRVASIAIKHGFDKQLTDKQKVFLYMPFMHSENLQDQDYSVSLFELAGLQVNLRYAKHHRGIIARFGHFPHRNAILGRKSTPEEIAYLDSPEAFHG